MHKRISIAVHEYDGKIYKPGDEVEVLPEHCLLLLALGNIKPEAGEPGFTQERPRKTLRKATA